MATALSASSRLFLLMLVGQRGSYGYGSERKVCPSTLHPPSLFTPLSASPLSPGSLAIPLVLQIPGSPSATYMSSLRGVSLPPVRFTRRGVPVFPYSRFAAPESALHRRRINTGRHPNSLEVNASFPRAPTTSTSYLPYPTTSFQKPDEGSRPCGEGDFHLWHGLSVAVVRTGWRDRPISNASSNLLSALPNGRGLLKVKWGEEILIIRRYKYWLHFFYSFISEIYDYV